jgi:hypothetical protein
MAQTIALVHLHLPPDLASITMGYVCPPDTTLYESAKHGFYELIDIDVDKHERFSVFCGACMGGHSAIIDLAIRKGETSWYNGIWHAAAGGHLDIVLNLMARGPANYDDCLQAACCGGNVAIVSLMIERSTTPRWNDALFNACSRGHPDAAALMIEHGATSTGYALLCAAAGGHLPVIDLLIAHGANTWNAGLTNAARGGHLPVVQSMINHGATDIKIALDTAVAANKPHVVAFLKLKLALCHTPPPMSTGVLVVDNHVQELSLEGDAVAHFDVAGTQYEARLDHEGKLILKFGAAITTVAGGVLSVCLGHNLGWLVRPPPPPPGAAGPVDRSLILSSAIDHLTGDYKETRVYDPRDNRWYMRPPEKGIIVVTPTHKFRVWNKHITMYDRATGAAISKIKTTVHGPATLARDNTLVVFNEDTYSTFRVTPDTLVHMDYNTHNAGWVQAARTVDGVVWIATLNGIFQFDPKAGTKGTQLPFKGIPQHLAVWRGKHLIALTHRGAGVIYYDGEEKSDPITPAGAAHVEGVVTLGDRLYAMLYDGDIAEHVLRSYNIHTRVWADVADTPYEGHDAAGLWVE